MYIGPLPRFCDLSVGRRERYMEGNVEEASYTMMVALNTASMIPTRRRRANHRRSPVRAVRQYNLANAIMVRLTHVIDRAALTAIMSGVTLDLTTLESAGASATTLGAAISDPAVKVVVRSDEVSEKHALHRAHAPR